MIRAAEKNEYEKVLSFYDKLIDDMQGCKYHPKWQKGIYPDPEELKIAVENSELFIDEEADEIVAAMRINHEATDGYEKVSWTVDAAKEEVTVIHMLGVAVRQQGKGIAKKMVKYAIDTARRENQKAVRLDVLVGNTVTGECIEAFLLFYFTSEYGMII